VIKVSDEIQGLLEEYGIEGFKSLDFPFNQFEIQTSGTDKGIQSISDTRFEPTEDSSAVEDNIKNTIYK